jgi:DNA polymerase III alpha subunit (gram-positive type)
MRFVAFDLEHTGGGESGFHLTEVAAIEFDQSGRLTGQQLRMLVNPGVPINYFIRHLTGISSKMVHDKSTEANAAAAFRGFSDGAILIGHGTKADLALLAASDPHIAEMPAYDTQRIAEALFPKKKFPNQRYGLADLVMQFGNPGWHKHPHRAYSDAAATGRVFFALRDYCETQLDPGELADLRKRFPLANTADTRGKFFHEMVRTPHSPELPVPDSGTAPRGLALSPPASRQNNTLHLPGRDINLGDLGLTG